MGSNVIKVMCRMTRGLAVLKARAASCDSKPGLERPGMIVALAVEQREGKLQEGKRKQDGSASQS